MTQNRRDFLKINLTGLLLAAGLLSLNSRGSKQMKILIETIPHKDQRYPTVGDWQWKDAADMNMAPVATTAELEPVLHIHVSEMSDWRYEALVAVHELVEALLCKYGGISEEQVDQFDMHYEELRKQMPATGSLYPEPGDDPSAPYFHEHRVATAVETRLAGELEVDWDSYEEEVNSL